MSTPPVKIPFILACEIELDMRVASELLQEKTPTLAKRLYQHAEIIWNNSQPEELYPTKPE